VFENDCVYSEGFYYEVKKVCGRVEKVNLDL
jgi:hypothetical protein